MSTYQLEVQVKDDYQAQCPVCKSTITIEPSIFQKMGMNTGLHACPECKSSLKLEISDDNQMILHALESTVESEIEPKENSNEDIFASVEKMKDKLQEDFIGFGTILSEIKRKGTYKVKGYKTFKDFIETEYNISGAFANKLIDVYELYIEDLDVDEFTLNQIGFERLNMIKPFVKDSELSIAETWLDEAKEKSTPELRQSIKDEKEKTKKPKSFKEVFTEQFIEKMTTYFNCSSKSLMFKLAIYFQDVDLEDVKMTIKEKQKKLEQSGEFAGMFASFKEGE